MLEDVKSLGKKGQIVNVSDGYARNLLLPKKLGVEATGKNMDDLKLQKAHEDKVAQENLDDAKAFAEKILPICEKVFDKYPLSDDFSYSPEYEQLYSELTGTMQIYIEEHVI